MDNKKRIENLKDEKYLKLFGVDKATFEKLLEKLNEQYQKEHSQSNISPKLSVLDKLIITLSCRMEYRNIESLSFDYNVSERMIKESINWVEKIIFDTEYSKSQNRRKKETNALIKSFIEQKQACYKFKI